MINTEWTWINSKQLEILRRCFDENQQVYITDLKAEKSEFKSVAILASLLPIILIIMFVADAYLNDTPIDILSLLVTFIPLLLLFFMIWGMTKNPKIPYKNRKWLIEILEKFKSLSTNSETKSNTKSEFYSTAHKQKILNWIPNKIRV